MIYGAGRAFKPVRQEAPPARKEYDNRRKGFEKGVGYKGPVQPAGDGDTLMNFGQYAGKETYREVLENHPGYCDWIKTQASGRGALGQFKEWLETQTVVVGAFANVPASPAGGGEKPGAGASTAAIFNKGPPPPRWVTTLKSQVKSQLPPFEPPPRMRSERADALFPYQREGICFGRAHNGRVMLGDEMGLGKTAQALGIACFYPQWWPVLVVCPAAVRFVWEDQITFWMEDSVTVQVIKKGADALTDADFTVISYEQLVRHAKIRNMNFKLIIVDESHFVKNWTAKRTKMVGDIAKSAKGAILLSGTPATNRCIELYTQIEMLCPSIGLRFKDFGQRYCTEVTAYGGRSEFRGTRKDMEPELSSILTMMIRRLKRNVLKDLPSKQYVEVKVEEEPAMARALQKDMQRKEASDQNSTAWGELYVRSGQCKARGVVEYLKVVLEGTEQKIVVFAHHKVVLEILDAGLKEYFGVLAPQRLVRVDGGSSAEEKRKSIAAFQDGDAQVALLSVTACSTGITLTASSWVMFAELHPSRGIMTQAEDRVHRVGQERRVVVSYLIGSSGTDRQIQGMLKDKDKEITAVFDKGAQPTQIIKAAAGHIKQSDFGGLDLSCAETINSPPRKSLAPEKKGIATSPATPTQGEQTRKLQLGLQKLKSRDVVSPVIEVIEQPPRAIGRAGQSKLDAFLRPPSQQSSPVATPPCRPVASGLPTADKHSRPAQGRCASIEKPFKPPYKPLKSSVSPEVSNVRADAFIDEIVEEESIKAQSECWFGSKTPQVVPMECKEEFVDFEEPEEDDDDLAEGWDDDDDDLTLEEMASVDLTPKPFTFPSNAGGSSARPVAAVAVAEPPMKRPRVAPPAAILSVSQPPTRADGILVAAGTSVLDLVRPGPDAAPAGNFINMEGPGGRLCMVVWSAAAEAWEIREKEAIAEQQSRGTRIVVAVVNSRQAPMERYAGLCAVRGWDVIEVESLAVLRSVIERLRHGLLKPRPSAVFASMLCEIPGILPNTAARLAESFHRPASLLATSQPNLHPYLKAVYHPGFEPWAAHPVPQVDGLTLLVHPGCEAPRQDLTDAGIKWVEYEIPFAELVWVTSQGGAGDAGTARWFTWYGFWGITVGPIVPPESGAVVTMLQPTLALHPGASAVAIRNRVGVLAAIGNRLTQVGAIGGPFEAVVEDLGRRSVRRVLGEQLRHVPGWNRAACGAAARVAGSPAVLAEMLKAAGKLQAVLQEAGGDVSMQALEAARGWFCV